MSDAQFATWWEYARKLDEFRGVSMAAAYAAWLAGIASRHSDPIPTLSESELVTAIDLPPFYEHDKELLIEGANPSTQTAQEAKPKRRGGKYRAEE